MWSHYLLTLYRSLTRHRLYAALNVMGLAVGIAVFLVLTLLVRFETSFDRWIPHADSVFRVDETLTFPGRAPALTAATSAAALPALEHEYPQILAGVRIIQAHRTVFNGSIPVTETIDYVDPSFFGALDLPIVDGAKQNAFGQPDDIVVTEAVAKRYFGVTNVVGRTLVIGQTDGRHLCRITAVLQDPPVNSHLKLAILTLIPTDYLNDPNFTLWGSLSSYTYLRLKDHRDARAITADLPDFVQRRVHDSGPNADPNITKMVRLTLRPISSLHFADAALLAPMRPGADARLVYSLGIVGVLTLLIALLNYVNLATARAGLRAREIALRKVMGATRRALMVQLLIESLMFAMIATLIGLALTELAIPMVNALGGANLGLIYLGGDGILIWLAGLALAIGLFAGAYPALLLSRFAPAPVLASARTPGGGRRETVVRAILIGAQFVVAITFTICTLVIASQAHFIRAEDRGFHREGLIIVDSLAIRSLATRQNDLLDRFRAVPGVIAASASLRSPGQNGGQVVAVNRPGQKGSGAGLNQDLVADNYLKAYGSDVIAGRMFDRAHGLDDVGGPYDEKGAKAAAARGVSVMLNESAVRTLGFASPSAAVGQSVYVDSGGVASPIIGVLRDVRFGAPQTPTAPVVYLYDSQPFAIGPIGPIGAVRYAGVSDAEMMRRLRAVWRRAAPAAPFDAHTAESSLSDFYVPDEQRARLFTIGAVLAVGISCVGLYGLAAFNTARRFKEIGIRKTLGASTTDVLRLLLIQILRPVVIANLIAWPIAYVAMRAWLSGFDQRIALSPLFFLAASVLALAVACATVVAQSLRLARSEPAKALHHE